MFQLEETIDFVYIDTEVKENIMRVAQTKLNDVWFRQLSNGAEYITFKPQNVFIITLDFYVYEKNVDKAIDVDKVVIKIALDCNYPNTYTTVIKTKEALDYLVGIGIITLNNIKLQYK